MSVPTDPIDTLLEGLSQGRIGALARAITLVENSRPGFENLLSVLHTKTGAAWRLGITGSPGIGKSTLVQAMVRDLRHRGRTVAVVAVDPTSPFTGGALLGDRVRMDAIAGDTGVFIRSMATRGAEGGLAITTREVCDVLDAYGFDVILIETVGVGQSELAITATADLALLTLGPESGDGVQMLKAGIMEIADLYVVNKSDRPGASQLAAEINEVLALRGGMSSAPPVLLTSAVNGEGIEALIDTVELRMNHLVSSGELTRTRQARLLDHTKAVVNRSLARHAWRDRRVRTMLEDEWERVAAGELSAYALADHIVKQLLGFTEDPSASTRSFSH